MPAAALLATGAWRPWPSVCAPCSTGWHGSVMKIQESQMPNPMPAGALLAAGAHGLERALFVTLDGIHP